jgi:hypothetical protein
MVTKADQTPFEDWSWTDETLHLNVSSALNFDELTGFLILR